MTYHENEIAAQITPQGSQTYPQYNALWHLRTLGILDKDHKPVGWDPTKPPQKRTRIAIIDTSVAVAHPNLAPAINSDLALDLFSSRLGAFPYLPKETVKIGELNLNSETNVAQGLPITENLLVELNDRMSQGAPVLPAGVQPCTSAEFSNHGTAIAGLVGARPCMANASLDGSTKTTAQIPLPYMGVDPMCEIIPISTNFDPNPESLVIAFLYAELIRADVILVPRTIPDPSRITPELKSTDPTVPPLGDLISPIPTDGHEADLWDELAALIDKISINRPVICAAGNANEENGIYPANLASEHNGVISVGALNAKGHRSSYSPTQNITITAPSNDGEVFDRGEVRLDEQRFEYSATGVPIPNNNHKFSSFDVISTDIPGPAGYATSPFAVFDPRNPIRDFGSYFCRFGGTSAASAIAAGFLSLAYSSGRLTDKSGANAKAWLLANSASVQDDEYMMNVPEWQKDVLTFPDGA